MYSNIIQNFQESTTILNAYTKRLGNLLNVLRIYTVYYKSEYTRHISADALAYIFMGQH